MKVCVIGCGAVARRAHIPAFQSLPNVQVSSVVDVDEELAKTVAAEFKIKKYYTDFKEALSDEEIELVSICTPSQTHAEMIILSSKMGKHVLVEKPLTVDLKEAKTVLETVKDNKVQLCVMFNYRMFPAVQQARWRIRSGGIGRIASMGGVGHTSFPVSWTRSRWLYHYGGALDDFGPHLIDLLLWLNPSKVQIVSAMGGDFTNEFGFLSHVQVNMQFHDTSVAVADISWLTDLFIVDVDVHGTAGRLICDVKNNHLFEAHGQVLSPIDELTSTAQKSLGIVKSVLSGRYFRGPLAYHARVIEEFIESINEKTKPPISGEEALLVTAVSTAAKQSLRTGKAVFLSDLLE
jgi:predicted dehydrogenase